jgi:hypothetical protein
MKNKPRWLSWAYSDRRLPQKMFQSLDHWKKTSDWFLSAPHFTEDHGRLKNYATAELWTLGIGLIIQELVRIYQARHADGASVSVPFMILQNWIRELDRKAEVVIRETIEVLRSEFINHQSHGKTDEPSHSPRPAILTRRHHTPSIAEPIGTPSASNNAPGHRAIQRLHTRSMTREANKDSRRKSTRGTKRKREGDNDLPVIAEATEPAKSAPKRKRSS